MPAIRNSKDSQPRPDSNEGLWRFSFMHFLIALGLLLVTLPFIMDLPAGQLIETVLFTFVLVFAVLAVGGNRRILIFSGFLVIPPVTGYWLDHFGFQWIPRELTLAASAVFSAFVIAQMLSFILFAPRVDANVLFAGIATYLMIGVLWSFGYILVARLVPNAFAFNVGPDGSPLRGFDAMYFSFITLTTLGYGDIVPVARAARQLAVMEAATGTIFVTVMIARLVSLYSGPQQAPPEGNSQARGFHAPDNLQS